MAHEIVMPKLGLTMTEGTVEEWKFREGAHVKKGDVLLSISTDKLTNDVEATASGVPLTLFRPFTGKRSSLQVRIGRTDSRS